MLAYLGAGFLSRGTAKTDLVSEDGLSSYKLIYVIYILYSRNSQTLGRTVVFSQKSQELDFISVANEDFMGIISITKMASVPNIPASNTQNKQKKQVIVWLSLNQDG